MDKNFIKSTYNISVWNHHKLNYWGTPKCGHTSIKLALSEKNENYNKTDLVKWVHDASKVSYVDRETALSNGNKNFGIVRHPYERFISIYKDKGLRRPLFYTNITFDDFLNKIVKKHNDDNTCDKHIRTLTSYLCDKDKNILVDDVVQLDEAEKYLGDFNLQLRTVNKTFDMEINLTDKQKEKIYNRYKDDFEVFGYKE